MSVDARILVIDHHELLAGCLRFGLEGRHEVAHSRELCEAEALLATTLYSVVVARASSLGWTRREQLAFVQFAHEQSRLTRLILVDDCAQTPVAELAEVVDLVLRWPLPALALTAAVEHALREP